MSHNIALSENPNTAGEIGRLTIAATPKASPYGLTKTLRVSRVRGGLRFLADKGGAHVHGEDLYALRAMLEELPEELFVEPAPTTKVDRWALGDRVMVVDWNRKETAVYERGEQHWALTDGNVRLWQEYVGDYLISRFLDAPQNPPRGDLGGEVKVLDQASGIDL